MSLFKLKIFLPLIFAGMVFGAVSVRASYLPITGGSNIGIGTTTPQTLLSIMNGNVGIGTWTAGGGNLIVNGGGNVGIGSAWPGQVLDVNGTVRMVGFSMPTNAQVGYVLTSSSIGVGTWEPASGGISGLTTNYLSKASGPSSLTNSLIFDNGTNVGVGNATPAAALDINGGINATGSGDSYFSSGNLGVGTTIPQAAFVVANGNVGIGTWTAGGGNLIVNGGGNVGIGSAWPGQVLDVNGTVRATAFVGNGSGLTNLSAGGWTLGTNNVGISTMNNVGIGSASPGQILDVSGTARMTGFTLTTGAVAGDLLVTNAVGLGTWMPASAALSQSGGNTMVTNWPDAIRCTSSTRGEVVLYPDNLPFTDGNYYYFEPSAGFNDGIVFNSSGTETTNQGLGTLSNCTTNITTLYTQGRAYNYVKGGGTLWNATGSNIYFGGGNVGIGTITPQAGLVSINNVGIGTWTAGGGNLIVNGGGNVGIGSAWPGQVLDVNGTVRATGITAGAGGITLGGVNNTSWPSGGSNYWNYSSSGNIGISTSQAVGIGTTFVGGVGEGALTIMNGNIGIGTWTPAFGIDYRGSTVNFVAQLNASKFVDVNNGFYWVKPSGTAGISAILGGNVGIGTTTVNNQLVVNGGVGIGTANSAYVTTTAPSGGIIVQGNVGIGTTIPPNALYVSGTAEFTGLHLDGNGAGSGYVMVGNSIGLGTWMPASTLPISGGSSDGWTLNGSNIYNTTGSSNVGIGTTTPQGGFVVTNGNVGIGTWVPSGLFQVAGSMYIGKQNGSVAGGGGLYFYQEADGTAGQTANIYADYNGLYFNAPNGYTILASAYQASGALSIQENGGSYKHTLWWFDGDSGTGTGTHFEGSATDGAASFGFKLGDTAGASSLNVQNSSSVKVFNVLSSGNVGIGTSTPQGGLIVTNGNVGIGTWVPNEALGFNNAGSIGWANSNNISVNSIYYGGTGSYQFNYWNGSGSVPLMYLSSGNVGIGTTTPQGGLVVTNGNVGIGTWAPTTTLAINGSIAQAPVTLTAGATVATNAALGNYFRVTPNQAFTLSDPSLATDGQKVVWDFYQASTTYVMTLDSHFKFGADISSCALSTGSGPLRDFMTAVYNSSTGNWYVVACVHGYTS